MKKISSLLIALGAFALIVRPALAVKPTDKGFNDLGYNYNARIFSGLADGTDKVLDGKVWGDPTYANDHLTMKWNAQWDNCNEDRTPENCVGAWENNEWNGAVPNGSGEVWHYKIIWVGKELETSQYWIGGGYPIWNEYEVIMDHGTVDGNHIWYTHGIPTGYNTK